MNKNSLKKGFLFIFIGVSLLLGVLFVSFLQSGADTPLSTGSIIEGVVGAPRFLNPLLATRQSEHDINALIYSGLLKRIDFDQYIPDLAQSYSVNNEGTQYTFTLRKEIFFHDNRQLTSDDIVFTIKAIQNPEYKSPYALLWKDIAVTNPDARTIVFTLPRAYSGFLNQVTIGVLPEHIWGQTGSQSFAHSLYNANPIGTGPFKINPNSITYTNDAIAQIDLTAFDRYIHGEPFTQTYIVRFFTGQQEAMQALRQNKIQLFQTNDSFLNNLADENTLVASYPQPTLYSLFIQKKSQENLADQKVLRALRNILYSQGDFSRFGTKTLDFLPGPLLKKTTQTTSLDSSANSSLLIQAGWVKNNETEILISSFSKEEPLVLTVSNNETFIEVAEQIKHIFSKIDLPIEIEVADSQNLRRETIPNRSFDILLFGQQYMHPSDVYAFWHSSNRDFPGLNIVEYINPAIDTDLKSIRSTQDPEEILKKLKKVNETLLKTQDVPVIPLYSSNTFIGQNTQEPLHTMFPKIITEPKDRYAFVHQWHHKKARLWSWFVRPEQ